MELSPLAPNTPQKLPAPSVSRESYTHLSFNTDPKKALLKSTLKHLKLLPLGDLVDELMSTLLFGDDAARTAAAIRYESREIDILRALETETHINLFESIEGRYREFSLQHCAELIEEYGCTTPSEKMLCEMAAGAIARHFSSLRKLNSLRDEYLTDDNHRTTRPTRRHSQEYHDSWTLVKDRIQRIAAESKEADRSIRQYQTIIAQLTQRKSPVPEVHIKTAFLARNQQFNAPGTL